MNKLQKTNIFEIIDSIIEEYDYYYKLIHK